ncbi:hypothetical protein KA005_18700, partial [bacterium]|nr:hypothetical protein [bacterium]
KEAQIIQRELDLIEVNITVLDKISKDHEKIILERLYKYIGRNGINYVIKNVDHIRRNERGKFKFVKNFIDSRNYR